MIKVLNNPKLETNFTLVEFMCNCGCKETMIDTKGIHLLQKIREHFGKTVTIYSPYRCEKHNKKVGGTTNSFHLLGKAYDIVVDDIHPLEVARYAISIGFTGVGVYTQNNWFTHLDTRAIATYWKDIKGSKQLHFVDKL